MRHYKHLDAITALFVSVLLISNVASAKILDLGPFTFDGGTILFPLSYIFGDILTEVYGYSCSRRVIWMGFMASLLMSAVFLCVGALPPAVDWPHQEAYDAILGVAPRIVLASLAAYFCGEFVNSYVMARLKVKTEGRFLWLRTISSTLFGQVVDTVVFVVVAFAGVVPLELVGTLIASNYVFKTLVEIAFTPATYAVVGYLKRSENEDYYDRRTDFNPFRVGA
jgi:uncharacterized integral membrane protein (TIGR00697 family)